tara:strand:+ start:133 stop:525 length:393 start_codon:yes stop_codon:yes gene_type:complete
MNFTFTNKNGQPIPKTSNNAIVNFTHGMPMKDGVSDNSNTFSINRFRYMQSFTPNLSHNESLQNKFIGGNQDSSFVISKNKSNAIANSTLNKDKQPMSLVNTKNTNVVDSALRRVRAGGSVAPKKSSMIK